jgi:hypothetical protein
MLGFVPQPNLRKCRNSDEMVPMGETQQMNPASFRSTTNFRADVNGTPPFIEPLLPGAALSMMRSLPRIAASAAYFLLIAFLLLTSSSQLIGAELVNIVIRNYASKLLIDIKLKDVFTEDLKSALSKGIPLDIAFTVSLYEVNRFWFDRKMISNTAIHQVRFDTLKKEYKIQRSWEGKGFRSEKNTAAAQRIITEIKGLNVISLDRLNRGSQYQLRIKSELNDRSYPFAGTPWEFETDWYTINFIF